MDGRYLRPISFALAMSVAVTVSAQRREPDIPAPTNDRLLRLADWVKAAAFHEPGAIDEWASRVGSWTSSQVSALWLDAYVLVQLMRNPSSAVFKVRPFGQSRSSVIRYTESQLYRMRVLACSAAGTIDYDIRCLPLSAALEGDEELRRVARLAETARTHGDRDNDVLRRAALLHADVAMLIPPAFEPIDSTRQPGPLRVRIQTADGVTLDLGQLAPHWELARMLLDNIRPAKGGRPAPARDNMVRLFYRATAAWMQAREQHDTVHLEHARAIFHNDPDILFLSGCQHEAYAAPSMQGAVQSMVVPDGMRANVPSPQSELRQAEGYFRGALAARPGMVEARLHYGRVLYLLERYAESAESLRAVAASTVDDELRYDAELFLGAVETALRHVDAAREAYTRAARLRPTAQTPRIALSELARRSGDREAAMREMQVVFNRTARERDDPWWRYFVSQARDADDLLENLRRPFRSDMSK